MVDATGVEGIIVARLWDPQKFHNFRNHNGIIVAEKMIQEGLVPSSQITTHNTLSAEGLNWIRAQIFPHLDPYNLYKTKYGEMSLGAYTGGGSFPRKKLVITTGLLDGQTVQDAWWDVNEANGADIRTISTYTYVDGTTPATSLAKWYSSADLPQNVFKTAGNPQTLTITRYESFVKYIPPNI